MRVVLCCPALPISSQVCCWGALVGQPCLTPYRCISLILTKPSPSVMLIVLILQNNYYYYCRFSSITSSLFHHLHSFLETEVQQAQVDNSGFIHSFFSCTAKTSAAYFTISQLSSYTDEL